MALDECYHVPILKKPSKTHTVTCKTAGCQSDFSPERVMVKLVLDSHSRQLKNGNEMNSSLPDFVEKVEFCRCCSY